MEKYDNSIFYDSYKKWLETSQKKYWDQMFMEVLNYYEKYFYKLICIFFNIHSLLFD